MEQPPDHPQETLTNCPECGHELDLAPPNAEVADMSMTDANRARRSRSAFGRLVVALRTGKITENPGDEALDVLMTHGFSGVDKFRSAELIPKSVPASERRVKLRPAKRV